MQRKYRRSLSASRGSSVPHSSSHRSSLSPYQSWQNLTPPGPTGNTSPPPQGRYHPYTHHPRTPPATPDRAKAHISPQSLPSLQIPNYPSSGRSPFSAPPLSNPTTTFSGGEYGAPRQLPDIHTVFSSRSEERRV